jgi:hypothetical protein
MKKNIAIVSLVITSFGGVAAANEVPSGWTCNGTCGSSGADGVVPLSPGNSTQYQYISTAGSAATALLPTGSLGAETNGSTLATSVFDATSGSQLEFYFDYVTSDGAGFSDYAWAELFDAANHPLALLFSAQTVAPPGNIVPGQGMPAPLATLTPSSVSIIDGTTWSPLGSSSGSCYALGCGNSGWVGAIYTIPTGGSYYLEVGVTNMIDESFDSGLAMDGVTVGGVPVGASATPEPGTMLLMGIGLALLGRFRKAAGRLKG